jgi:serine/threonine protein kinase
MKAFTWNQIQDVVDAVLELPLESRSRYLDQTCSDPELRSCVESLILSSDQAGGFLDQPAIASHLSGWAEGETEHLAKPWVGRRIGPYQISEALGQGGMGTVYRAVRADDQYQKQVAIKLVRSGFDSRIAQARFKSERQILATLEHPNIARLLDGGATDEGSPYFVMELVDGRLIDKYCDAHKLSILKRLRLFRTVCSAVQYAHQNLVVHRDLKPANILVTPEGVPKLLDFGIAKILDAKSFPLGAEPTVSFLRMLTPQYASPEQLRGEAISTASDVYSLGVVLYILLTGHTPYKLDGLSPEAIARVVCEQEPARPSAAVERIEEAADPDGDSRVPITPEVVSTARATSPHRLIRRLTGDLDNIVLKALRKESQHRYSSVEQFSEDIRHHLEKLPVVARKDTLRYRTGKFVRRNRVGVASAALLLLSLCGGLATTLWEAHVARLERAKAERRFNDVRELANSLMFEIHDGIKDLPGSTPTRKLLVDRALKYLDSLAREASGDVTLQRELAAAYERLGDVQGDASYANLGDNPGALQSFRKALIIRESVAANSQHTLDDQRRLSGDYNRIGRCLGEMGDQPGALDNLRKALSITEKVAATANTPSTLDALAGGHYFLAIRLERAKDFAASAENFRQAAAIHQSIKTSDPTLRTNIRTHLAGDYAGLSQVLVMQGRLAEGTEMHKRAERILKELLQADPTNASLMSFLGENYAYFGDALAEVEPEQALANYRDAEATFQSLSSADPANALAKRYLGFEKESIGSILSKKENTAEGLEELAQALAIFKGLAIKEPRNIYVLLGLEETYQGYGQAYATAASNTKLPVEKRMKHWQEARSRYQKGLDILIEMQHRRTLEIIDAEAPKEVADKIASCDVELARLRRASTLARHDTSHVH